MKKVERLMHRSTLLALLLIFVFVITSCTGQKSGEVTTADEGTLTYLYKDSCQHLSMSLSLELPAGNDSVSLQIRDSLIADFIRSVEHSYATPSEENGEQMKPFAGNADDMQAMVDYYGKMAYGKLLGLAKADYEDRMTFLEEDTTMTEEDKERVRNDVPMWAFDLSISKTVDATAFVVYYSQSYCYYGGAHGGVSGSGALTFNKATGSKIENFISADATKAMQPLIRKGLLQYYSDAGEAMTEEQLQERLQIEGEVIPQPYRTPYPNAAGDSLTFTYGQYEIACYADGMPSFSLSVKELSPYLTKEGKSVLGQE